MKNLKSEKEWFLNNPITTLKPQNHCLNQKRYIYTISMCHLSIEKALKGIYVKKFKTNPPKIHDLLYLIKKINIELPENYLKLIESLNEISVPIRYPENLTTLIKHFKKVRTKQIFFKVKNLFRGLRLNKTPRDRIIISYNPLNIHRGFT